MTSLWNAQTTSTSLFYAEDSTLSFITDDWASYPISKGDTIHAPEKVHFGHLYPQESRNKDWSTVLLGVGSPQSFLLRTMALDLEVLIPILAFHTWLWTDALSIEAHRLKMSSGPHHLQTVAKHTPAHQTATFPLMDKLTSLQFTIHNSCERKYTFNK